MTDKTLPVRDAFNEQAEQLARTVGATLSPAPLAAALRLAASGSGPYGHLEPNELTRGELERLALIAEECGEVIQTIGKIFRFGWTNGQYDNRQQLEEELGDVSAVVNFAVSRGDLTLDLIERHADDKLAALPKLLRFS